MAQYMGKVGFFVGLYLGILARDQFTYTMPEKMDSVLKDYEGLNKDIDSRIKQNQKDLDALKMREKELERRYLYLKERVLQGED